MNRDEGPIKKVRVGGGWLTQGWATRLIRVRRGWRKRRGTVRGCGWVCHWVLGLLGRGWGLVRGRGLVNGVESMIV